MQIPLSSHALGYGDQRYAVPLTQEFFDYFDHRDLETRSGGMLEVLPGDDQVTVKLHLPVGDSEECTFMRVYRNEDIIRAEDIDPNGSEIPALGVWPDFCDAGWRGNFAIHAGPPHSKLRIQPLTLDRTEIPKTTRDDGNSQVWECSSPVLGFALFFEDDREKTVPIGMVLRKEANSAARLDQRLAWDVSLDFGTSNTHVCYRASGKAEIHELSLERRLLPLTKGSDALVREAAINLYPERGLRNAPIAVPLATVLNNREEITSFRDRQRGSPFFPCLEYEPYLNEYEVIDVKWSGSDAGIKEYLKGLVRHIAAEARKGGVATLNFHWSFPLSLPANQRRAMQAFWNTLRAEEIWGDLKLTVPQPGISESEATLRAIASHTPPILPVGTGRSLVIDVGGGSTDVAFWSPSGMEEQFSLKLGGSDLLNPLCTQEAVRDALIRACTGREPDDFIRSKFELRTAILTNYCLSHGTSSDGVRFGDMNPCSHPIPQHLFGASEDLAMDRGPWSVARTAIYLFFSGLSFYLGLCSREWIKKSKSEDGSQEGGFLSLYFGGRGSNLLAWLFNDSKYLRQVLKDAFMQGLTSEGHSAQSLEVGIQGPVFEFHRDLKPKTEVARGLLCPPVVKAFGMEDQLNEQTMPVEHGWKIDGDKQPLHWNHRLSRSDMAHLKAPSREDYSHTYIARFLEAVVPVHARALSLDEDLKGISPNWMAISEKVRQSVDERFPLQPLFIWELTSVIEAYLALRFGMVRGVGQ
jgi:hypothetical protein